MPGSTLPDLLLIGTPPSSGVNPIEVSMLRPSRTAPSEAPAPRYRSRPGGLPGTSSAPGARPGVDSPWKPSGGRPSAPSTPRQRVGIGRGGQPGVEGGVEAATCGTSAAGAGRRPGRAATWPGAAAPQPAKVAAGAARRPERPARARIRVRAAVRDAVPDRVRRRRCWRLVFIGGRWADRRPRDRPWASCSLALTTRIRNVRPASSGARQAAS